MLKRVQFGLAVASAAAICGLAVPASHADNNLEIGGFIGAHIFNDNSELGVADIATADTPANAIIFGLRLGYHFTDMFTAEGELGIAPTQGRATETDVTVIAWRAHALAHFLNGKILDGRLRPFAVLGLGALTSSPTDQLVFTTDSDLALHAGVGAKYRVGDNWGVRGDFRLLLPASNANESVTANWEILFSLYKFFPEKKKPAPKPTPTDRDGDGIDDNDDKCPDKAEDADDWEDEDGCPDDDNDGDGIPDGADRCPNAAETMNGVEDEDGCPEGDEDGDGIVGGNDKCPTDPEDKDGFEDADGCPDPDNDQDGVLDGDDKCPKTLETKNGFEDGDGCPDKLPDAVAKFSGTIKGIRFVTGSAKIRSSSNRLLNEAAAVLTQYPSIRLEIQGHTDSVGTRDSNITLSQRRADSVRSYLTGKGVDASRLTAKGFGPDSPVADNGTPAGRATNRRVDFKLLSN